MKRSSRALQLKGAGPTILDSKWRNKVVLGRTAKGPSILPNKCIHGQLLTILCMYI